MDYHFRLGISELQSLFKLLSELAYDNIGPVYRDGAIMLDHLEAFDQMAGAVSENVSKGSYRLTERDDDSLFQNTIGPMSFKKFLHPEKRKLWSADRKENGFDIQSENTPSKMAFWGIRSCDLHAIDILDEVFLNQSFQNSWYKKARENLFVIAVGCTRPSANCFCTSMNTGPEPQKGYDFLLVEMKDENGYYYSVSTGTEQAEEMAKKLNLSKIEESLNTATKAALQEAAEQMPIRLDPKLASEKIKNSLESTHWDEVAKKCLSCANCTLVCPTCFCTSTEDITDITGDHTERWLKWDSCFNGDFSYIHGGKIRGSTRSRYRQWFTHKLSNWYDQFGSSGCVGCGRCITWCPVGIDITEELKALSTT